MEFTTFTILVICVAGASWTSYRKGLMNGSEATLEILEEKKLIRVREDGDIEPYK
tara:strand:+ start:717 stop:881 length:165 start_codon:yes stop_codon:yes gene_type:complete